jgi:hypothetical protein
VEWVGRVGGGELGHGGGGVVDGLVDGRVVVVGSAARVVDTGFDGLGDGYRGGPSFGGVVVVALERGEVGDRAGEVGQSDHGRAGWVWADVPDGTGEAVHGVASRVVSVGVYAVGREPVEGASEGVGGGEGVFGPAGVDGRSVMRGALVEFLEEISGGGGHGAVGVQWSSCRACWQAWAAARTGRAAKAAGARWASSASASRMVRRAMVGLFTVRGGASGSGWAPASQSRARACRQCRAAPVSMSVKAAWPTDSSSAAARSRWVASVI